MSYATLSDIIDRYGERALVQLTDRGDLAAETVDEALVARMIADASALADGYLRARLELPLAETPPALAVHVTAIAYYLLQRDRPSEASQKGHDAAIAWLRDVAAGRVRLAAEPPAAAGEAQLISPERVMSRDSLKGF